MADKIKLLIAVLIVAAGIAGYYELADKLQIIRVGVVLASALIAIGVAYTSSGGKALVGFYRESLVETRKVVWPNRKETVQTTGIVILLVIGVAFVLMLVDLSLQSFMNWFMG
ncbi:MAG: preprotein translocase subunit SecE [Proteobacteria bacterium]|nr:preprotein translocase subunit SecE [Pseudomonadota bacterium]MDE3208974.1 preprotein translocase subunit SecE [Pseudomonadota bacterium]